MKKYLKLLFVAIFASMSFAFVACGDDEDDEPDNNGGSGNNTTSAFVGTWEMTSSGALGDGDGEAYFRFDKDKTFVLVNDYGNNDVEVSFGTWSNTKDTFTVNYEIFHGTSPIIPTVTYKIESTSSKSFKLSFGGQTFDFTKVSDSVMNKYQDEIDDVMGNGDEGDEDGNSGNDNIGTSNGKFNINGNTIETILSGVCGTQSGAGERWVYFDLMFNDGKSMLDFDGIYHFEIGLTYSSLSDIREGDDIMRYVDYISLACNLGDDTLGVGSPTSLGTSIEDIQGQIKVVSKDAKKIVLQYNNFRFTKIQNNTEKTFKINGSATYEIE